MTKVVPSKEFTIRRGVYIASLKPCNVLYDGGEINQSYFLVSNSKNYNNSFIVIEPKTFTTILAKAGFYDPAQAIIDYMKVLQTAVSEKMKTAALASAVARKKVINE